MIPWIVGGLSTFISIFTMLMLFSMIEAVWKWAFDRCIFESHDWHELPAFHACNRCGKLNWEMKDPDAVFVHPQSRFKGDGHTPR